MPKNWQARERKVTKRKNGMRVSNRSIFVVDEADRKRHEKKRERFEKRERKD